jgi:hypothetical protein
MGYAYIWKSLIMYQLPDTFFQFTPTPCSPEAFTDYWCEQYDYAEPGLYKEQIGVRPITPEGLRLLFAWKNGMPLSARKAQALEEKIIAKLPVIQALSEKVDEAVFKEHFGKLRVVWQVFLLHIIDPEHFPIFDQHVYRAYRSIKDIGQVGLEAEPKLTMAGYREYQVFYQELLKQYDGIPKRVDDALWAFGKFLSRYPWMVLHRIID